MSHRTIKVDESGHSCIVAVNSDNDADVGTYADGLSKGDTVELDDGTLWVVKDVHTRIQTGNPGMGASNYVFVDLEEEEEEE